jgi:hypothetical protein
MVYHILAIAEEFRYGIKETELILFDRSPIQQSLSSLLTINNSTKRDFRAAIAPLVAKDEKMMDEAIAEAQTAIDNGKAGVEALLNWFGLLYFNQTF